MTSLGESLQRPTAGTCWPGHRASARADSSAGGVPHTSSVHDAAACVTPARSQDIYKTKQHLRLVGENLLNDSKKESFCVCDRGGNQTQIDFNKLLHTGFLAQNPCQVR